MENFADLYTDYLISSTSYTTATGMASLLDIKHDQVTRSLSKGNYDSKYLWNYVKPFVEVMGSAAEPTVLSFDDSIEEKPYTDQSDLICWHFDHTFNRSIKGVNFLTAFVEVSGMRLPCSVEFVRKDLWKIDKKTGKQKRFASKTKNELFRQMLGQCHKNFCFDYVATDSWFSAIENMKWVKEELSKHFVMR